LIDRDNCEINLTRQAELLDISRSQIYYQPIINQKEIHIKNTIDKIYTDCPFYIKPSSEGFFSIYDKNISKSEYLFIGDSPVDIGAGKEAGVDFINIAEIKL
jgi:hypothetical protein